MYQEFFWDFDGTLYNTYPGMVEAFMDVFVPADLADQLSFQSNQAALTS